MSRKVALALFFAVGIAAQLALERCTEWFGWPTYPTVVRNTFSMAQATTLAIVAALVPKRRMEGAFGVVVFCAGRFIAEFVAGTKHSFSAWSSVDLVFGELAFTLTTFLVAQGCRVFAGWKIVSDDEQASTARGQFQLSALIEWMVTWGITLGVYRSSGTWAPDARHAASWAVLIIEQLLYGLPIAYLMLTPRLTANSVLSAIACLCVATPIWMFSQATYVRLATILSMWKQGVFAGVVFWGILTVHFLIIRGLGYRWTQLRKP